MKVVRDYIFKKSIASDKYNLIIGGVGDTITTPLLLADRFSFAEFNVLEFEVDTNNDVFAFIDVEYTLDSSAFKSNSSITRFIDNNKLLIGANFSAFESSTISQFFSEGEIVLTPSFFKLCSFLSPSNIHMPNAYISLSNSQSCFYGLKTDGTTLNLPSITSMSDGYNRSYMFRNNNGNTINLINCTSIQAKRGMGTSTVLGLFFGTVNLWRCVQLGNDPAIDNFTFYNCNSSTTININVFLATNNAGGEDADLAYARGRGATINYTDNNGNIVIP